MTGRNGKARRAKPRHNELQRSENETDTRAADVSPPTIRALRLDPSSTPALNLKVLQRHEPLTESIVFIAPFAVVYTYSQTSESWDKCGIEGTLFITKLYPHQSGGERYSVLILNRLGLNNFSYELTTPENVELSDEEFIVLNDLGEQGQVMVHGIWVFSDPSSTERKTAEITVQIMGECARISDATKQAAALANGLSGGEPLDRGRASVRSADLQPRCGDERLANQSPTQSTTPSSLTELFWKALLQYRGRGA